MTELSALITLWLRYMLLVYGLDLVSRSRPSPFEFQSISAVTVWPRAQGQGRLNNFPKKLIFVDLTLPIYGGPAISLVNLVSYVFFVQIAHFAVTYKKWFLIMRQAAYLLIVYEYDIYLLSAT